MRRVAAALFAVLLPFGVSLEGVHAQSSDSDEVLRTVTNIAEATWNLNTALQRVESNPVSFDVSPLPPTIQVYRRTTGSGAEITYRAPQCGPATGPAQQLRAGATASNAPMSSENTAAPFKVSGTWPLTI